MTEHIIALLFLLGMSTFCWIMVLRHPRGKNLTNTERFWRATKDRETWDACNSWYLLCGVLSIITLIVFTLVSSMVVDEGALVRNHAAGTRWGPLRYLTNVLHD
jgi:hypothetical protein